MAYLKSFYFKDEYGFPLSLSESMKYCELDKVPCLKCEESGKSGAIDTVLNVIV